MFRLLFFILFFMNIGQIVFAVEYRIDEGKRITVKISAEGVNRISAKGDRIAKVIGNDEEYSIEGDNSKGIIFVSIRLIAGEISPVTIITEKGVTQDINFKVEAGLAPQNIVLKSCVKKTSTHAKSNSDYITQERIAGWLKQLIKGETRDFSFRNFKNFDLEKGCYEDACKFYRELFFKRVVVTRTAEYSNRYVKIYRYEFSEKPSDLEVDSAIEGRRIAVIEFSNFIFVVTK